MKLISAGVALLVFAAIGCVALVRSSAADHGVYVPPVWTSAPQMHQPVVLLGYDGPYWRVVGAIRIDVTGGVAHRRSDGGVIEDVEAYVNSALAQNPRRWVVVSAAVNERFGGIVRVIEACRATHAGVIILNQHEVRE